MKRPKYLQDKDGLRWCSMCDEWKHLEVFPTKKTKSGKVSPGSICHHCRLLVQKRYRDANKEKSKKYWQVNGERLLANRKWKYKGYKKYYNKIRRNKYASLEARLEHRRKNLYSKFKLTLEQFDEMDKRQNSCCYVCMKHKDTTARKVLNVDHNHITGQVRKLLCSHCNTTLGLVNENPLILQSLINYIIEHSGQVDPVVTPDVRSKEQVYEDEKTD